MAKKDKQVQDGSTVQQDGNAQIGSNGEQAAAKKTSSKKSKKDKNASSTAENVTSNSNEDIPVPQLNEDGSMVAPPRPAIVAEASTSTSQPATEKTKKRKRKEGDEASNAAGTTTTAEPAKEKTKSKKSKKSKDASTNADSNNTEVPVAADQQASAIPQEVFAAVMAAPAGPSGSGMAAQSTDEASKKKKKKSKKATNGAEVANDDDEGMQVDAAAPTASNSIEGVETAQDENAKKKRKKKDKEANNGAEGDADATTTEKQKKQKKKQKDQESAAAAADARTRQSTSPLPDLPQRLPPIPPTSLSQAPDYENIDPALRPASRPAGTAITSSLQPPVASTAAPARSTPVSASGSTSIQPRDPSMPPPASSSSGAIVPTMPEEPSAASGGVTGADGGLSKKRGRPKKPVADDGDPAAPASAVKTKTTTTQRVTPGLAPPGGAPSTARAASTGITASTVAPGTRAPSSSVSPAVPTTALPAASGSTSTSAIAPSATAPVPSTSASTSTPTATGSATATTRLPPPSLVSANASSSAVAHIFPGVNPNTMARAAMNPDFVPASLPEGTTPLQPSENTEVHQELLASRWLNTKEMADLIQKEGLKVRAGKFSKAEDATLKLCIENYRQQQGLTQEQIDGIIFAKGQNTRADYGDFWTIITRAVPDRALMSVYHHTKRIMQTDARKGPWTQEEDDKLKAAYKQFGASWIKVAAVVGRWENDCRDRWRAYVGPNEKIQKGKWSKEEEDKLRETIRLVKIDIANWKRENARNGNGMPVEDEPAGGSDMFWSRVASKMGTRSRHQCRIKWNDHMKNKLLTADGKPIRWAKRDTFILVMKLHSLQLTDEDEIAWKLLPDSHWNWWSPHILHKRWFSMKQRAKKGLNKENASYREIVDWLKKEQDEIPRKEVKAFMAKKYGEADGADEDGDGEEEEAEAEEQETSTSAVAVRPTKKTSTSTAAVKKSIVERKKKTQDQSQFRTSEFVDTSEEEDE